MEHADRAGTKITLPSIDIEQATELPRIELYCHRINGEIPPGEILFNRCRLNRRQEGWLRVGLPPGRRNIHLEAIWKRKPRRRKPLKYDQPGSIPGCHQPREGDPIPFNRKIEIPVFPLQ
jgi:hypothetical protein